MEEKSHENGEHIRVVRRRTSRTRYLFIFYEIRHKYAAGAREGGKREEDGPEEEHIRMRWCRFSRGYEMRGLGSCEEPPGDNAMAWDVLKHFERESDWAQ